MAYWRGVRQLTHRLVPWIPGNHLEWAPAADRWTLGDLVRHFGAIERWMYGENVQGRPSTMVEHEAHHRGQIQLLLGLLGAKTPQIFGLTDEEVRARSSG